MNRKLVINVCHSETRVALIEEENLAEIFIERKNDSEITGNIYKARVQRVLPGMQAAFVDIGMDQAAFIYVDDVMPDNLEVYEHLFSAEPAQEAVVDPDSYESEAAADDEPAIPDDGEISEKRPIEEILRERQEIMVQVSKSPIGTKGARITSHVSLPGRYLVLMPTTDHVGISRRIEDEGERKRLRDIIYSLRTGRLGYIVRTAAEGANESIINREMQFLSNLWTRIMERHHAVAAPTLLHQELAVSLRAVRDLLLDDAELVIVDDHETYGSILSFLDTFMPCLKESVRLYDGCEPIFDAYNLEGDISRALKKKVWLKSGGYVVIEQTEALVAIDVNTGRYVGKHNLEETILKTNLEAVKEIACQVRLRDIGGIIIIDFIDMQKTSNQEKVFNALRDILKKDRNKTHILPISDMGLVQMTRKRVRKSLHRTLCEPCLYCDGEGYLLSGKTISCNIYRDVLREAGDMTGKRITIRVNPQIAELLHGEEKTVITTLEKKIGRQIVVYPKPDYHFEEFDIFETL